MADALAPCIQPQLDAQQLDDDILRVLGAQWKRVFAHCSRPLAEALEPERDALFRLLVWRLTFGAARARTPGQALQNLRMFGGARDAAGSAGGGGGSLARAAVVELLLAVLLPWLFDRLRARATADGWADADAGSPRRVAWRLLNACEGVPRFARFAGTLALLAARRPYAPRHVLTGARVGYAVVGAPAFALAFDFVGQQLLWEALTEHADLVASCAPSRAAVRSLGRRGARAARALLHAVGIGAVTPPAPVPVDDRTAELRCAECGACPPVVPCRALAQPHDGEKRPSAMGAGARGQSDPCAHVHCYACLYAALAADAHHECSVCARRVRAIARVEWRADGEPPPADVLADGWLLTPRP
ncbi:hypothetical protein KFE25_013336 [Diacronema lutheri]|uniref:RING-type E3 ubiquitin transferase (cysteine targeting) n=2 Tax=Diacronema lutheri TaxID=2081491 RepID=A0A8J5XN94_DIALT|nr:hypothetical protein KFE25_013336 [Diacronema lutheri]